MWHRRRDRSRPPGRSGGHRRDDGLHGAARPRRRRRLVERRRRARPPPAGDHRPVQHAATSPCTTRNSASPSRSTAASTTTPSCGSELLGKGYRFFSHSDTEVILKGYREWGERVVDHLKGMFAFAVAETDYRPGGAGARPARHQAAVLVRRRRGRRHGRTALRVVAARPGRRGRRGHRPRPGRPAPLPELPLRRARAAHDPQGRPQAARRARSCASSPTARRTEETYWEPIFERSAERAGWSERDWEDAILALAAHRGRAPPGRRRPGRLPAVRRAGLQPDRRAARRGRPARPGRPSRSASRPPAARRATSSSTPTSSPGTSAPTTTRSASTPPACCRR